MHILIVTEAFYPENFLINDLATQWNADGHVVDVLTQWPSYPGGYVYDGYNNAKYGEEPWGSGTIYRFRVIEGYKESKVKKMLNYWCFVRLGNRIVKKIGACYDHILVHQTGPLTVALPAVLAHKKFGIPVTVWTFDIWPDAVYTYGFPRIRPLEWLLSCLIRKVYSAADNIMVSSMAFMPTINQYVPSKHITYAPNWLLPAVSERSSVRFDSSKFNFTFTGNISISQNLDKVILGFAKAHINDAVLNIVGDGSSLGALRILINQHGIDNIVLYGRLPYSQMKDIMEQSDTLIVSLKSGSGVDKTEPYKLQSYLTAGKPIFGVIRGSGAEIIKENGLGICSDPTDIEDIASGFCDSINFARNNSYQVSVNAKKLLNSRYNRNKIIDSINSVIGMGE